MRAVHVPTGSYLMIYTIEYTHYPHARTLHIPRARTEPPGTTLCGASQLSDDRKALPLGPGTGGLRWAEGPEFAIDPLSRIRP